MSLTLKNVLDLEAFSDISVIAGDSAISLNRTVSGINIMEVPEVTDWMLGGEILCSSGFAFHGEASLGCKLIRDLDAHNIAALFLKPGSYMEKIPDKMIECANLLNFPLLQMPADRPYSDYMEPLYGLLLDKQLDVLRYANSLLNNIFNIALQSSCDQLLHSISVFLKQSVYLINNEGRNLAKYIVHNQDHSENIYNALKELPVDQGTTAKNITVYSHDLPLHLTYSNILLPNEKHAWLIFINDRESQRELVQLIIPFVGQLIQMKENHRQRLLEKEYEIAGSLLCDLIEEDYCDVPIILERGKMFNINLEGNLVLFIIEVNISCDNTLSEDYNEKKRNTSGQSLLQKSMNAVHNLIVYKLHHILSLIGDNSITVLAEMKPEDDEDMFSELIIEPLEKFANSLKNVNITVGVSRFNYGIENIPYLLSQARTALRVAYAEDKNCASKFYDRLGILRLFPELEKSSEMIQLVDEIISPILEYDKDHDTNFVNTLETLYLNDCNLTQTSRDLFIHKNTLLNHLDIMNDLVGCDVRRSQYMSVFTLCLKYVKHIKNIG